MDSASLWQFSQQRSNPPKVSHSPRSNRALSGAHGSVSSRAHPSELQEKCAITHKSLFRQTVEKLSNDLSRMRERTGKKAFPPSHETPEKSSFQQQRHGKDTQSRFFTRVASKLAYCNCITSERIQFLAPTRFSQPLSNPGDTVLV